MTTPNNATLSVQPPPSLGSPQGNATLPSTNKIANSSTGSTIPPATVAAVAPPRPLPSTTSNLLSKGSTTTTTTATTGVSNQSKTTPKPSTTTTKKRTDNRSRKKNAPASSTLVGGIPKTTLNAATAAAIRAEEELQAARAREEGRKMDAIWIRSRDPRITTSSSSSSTVLDQSQAILHRALLANGYRMEDVTPQAYGCLMEFLKQYTTNLLSEAQEYAWHCGRTRVEAKDLQLAVDLRLDEEDTNTNYLRPTSTLIAMAHEINQLPLPSIPNQCYNGIVLPPLEYQLTARTFDVVLSNTKTPITTTTSTNQNQAFTKPTTLVGQINTTTTTTSSYGANKSKQLSVVLQSHTKSKSTNNSTEPTPPPEVPIRTSTEAKSSSAPTSSTDVEKAILTNTVDAMSIEPTTTTTIKVSDEKGASAAEAVLLVDTTQSSNPILSNVEGTLPVVDSTNVSQLSVSKGEDEVPPTNNTLLVDSPIITDVVPKSEVSPEKVTTVSEQVESTTTCTSEEVTTSKSHTVETAESKDTSNPNNINNDDDKEVVKSGTIEEASVEMEGTTDKRMSDTTTKVLAPSETEITTPTEEPLSSVTKTKVDTMDNVETSKDVVMSEALPTSDELPPDPSTTSLLEERTDDTKESLKRKASEMESMQPEP